MNPQFIEHKYLKQHSIDKRSKNVKSQMVNIDITNTLIWYTKLQINMNEYQFDIREIISCNFTAGKAYQIDN